MIYNERWKKRKVCGICYIVKVEDEGAWWRSGSHVEGRWDLAAILRVKTQRDVHVEASGWAGGVMRCGACGASGEDGRHVERRWNLL